MGASVIGYWPDMTDEQLDLQPGFYNDCKAWGGWMATRLEKPDVLALHETLGVKSLLTFTTEGVEESEVDWVTPDELAAAANRLRAMALENDARVKPILDAYSLSANGIDDVEEEFAQDLWDVAEIAEFAKRCGAKKMTLEVNW